MLLTRVILSAWLCGAWQLAWAETPEAPSPEALASAPTATAGAPEGPVPRAAPDFSYQLGMAGLWQPTYTGSERMEWRLRPVVSLQWGRFRLSSSKAGLVEGPADGGRVGGASYALVESPRWSSGVALRADGGRSSSDDPRLAGLPELKPTLRGRAYARYSLEGEPSDVRSVGLTLSTDLLGRRGGTTLSLDVSRRVQLAPDLRWTHSLGLGAADAVYMRSNHGVSAELAPALGLRAFEPGAGLTDLHAGTGLVWRVHKRWRVGGTVTASRLLGPVADSPLTHQTWGYGLVLGLVYISGQD